MPEEISGSSFLRMTGLGEPALWQKRHVAGEIIAPFLFLLLGVSASLRFNSSPPKRNAARARGTDGVSGGRTGALPTLELGVWVYRTLNLPGTGSG